MTDKNDVGDLECPLMEILVSENSIQFLELEEFEEDVKYLAVEFGMRSLPLILWAVRNGYKVLTEDPWEAMGMNNYRERPSAYPENVSVSHIFSAEFETREFPVGMTKFFNNRGLEELPQLREPDDAALWDSANKVVVGYKLMHADGSDEIVKVRPDYFVFEDKDGRYNVFHQDESDVRTSLLIDRHSDAILRPHMDFPEFKFGSGDYHEDWFEEYRVTELRINAALAAGNVEYATTIARNHFRVPGKELE